MVWVLRLISLIILAFLGSYLVVDLKLKPLDAEARVAAPGVFADLSDGKLHYRWDGPEDGPVLVLVHGFSTPNFIYQQNVEALNAAGFRTLRFDHFGRGWSDRPRTRYDIEFYDRTLNELLSAAGVSQPFGLVGLSMGGPIVAEFTARYPERVDRLALLVPAGLDTAGADGASAALLRTPLIGDWVWRMFGKSILLGDPQYDEASRAPEYHLQGDVAEQFEYRGYLQALLSTFRHMPMAGREETYASLAVTGVPVLAIYGDADPTVLISSAARLESLMPEADIRIVEGGAHGLNYQRHDLVNPWLVDWFSSDQ
ncbi:MAG: alpha/beta hydrolase [Hyphomonadaceae bacterium]|nr:alpha/beta hydrolase [Hyphomonadaceae bacterium]